VKRRYSWKSKYGGLEVSEAQRLRQLEDENRRLKHLVTDLSLDKEVLKGVITKNGWSSQLNGLHVLLARDGQRVNHMV
jgi:hypothetical protein